MRCVSCRSWHMTQGKHRQTRQHSPLSPWGEEGVGRQAFVGVDFGFLVVCLFG